MPTFSNNSPFGTSSSLRRILQNALQKGIDERIFSGAQVCYVTVDHAPQTLYAGNTSWENGRAIDADTRFDIASLTKLFTTTVALSLVDSGKLLLDMCVWNGFTLEKLLAHETGLPPWEPFFEQIPVPQRGTRSARHRIISLVKSVKPASPAPPKAVYSDIGFIGLGDSLETITGKSLQNLIDEYVTAPLGMTKTGFVDSLSTAKNNIACTEVCPWRKRVLQGEVHDDNAFSMGGIAGHAGIFSTALDMIKLGRAWLDSLHNDGIVKTATARRAIERRKGGRGLGFDLKSEHASSVGVFASDQTFGHLGFTGTSLWADPKCGAIICLLTNRVHPQRNNIEIRAFRPYFHDLFFEAVYNGNTPNG